MPGRPKMQAKKVLALENKILDLEIDLLIATPDIYRDPNRKIGPNDQLGMAWDATNHAVVVAGFMLTGLGDMLRAKAGVPGPGPSEEFYQLTAEPEAQPSPDDNGEKG